MIFRLSDDETQSCDTSSHTHVYEEHRHPCHHHLRQEVTHPTLLVHTTYTYTVCHVRNSQSEVWGWVFFFFFFFDLQEENSDNENFPSALSSEERYRKYMFIQIEIYCLHSS